MEKNIFEFGIKKFSIALSEKRIFLTRLFIGILLWFLISLTTQNQFIDDWFIIAPYALPALLITIPVVLKGLKYISILFLKLSSPKLNFLSKIPMIQFAGDWFIEENSELVDFNSTKSVLKFFGNHWFSIFILPFSSFLILLRIIGSYESDTEVSILDIDTFRESTDDLVYYYTVFGTTIILLFYVSIIWIWHDAELKILKYKKSSKGDAKETQEIWLPSNTIKNLFTLFVGYDIMSRYLTGGAGVEDFYDILLLVPDFIIGVLFDYFILEGGFIFIALLLVYYTSGVHEYNVNEVRKYIHAQNSKEKHNISIGSSQIFLK